MRRIALPALVVLVCLGFGAVIYVLSRPEPTAHTSGAVWPPEPSNPYLVFQKVVNDCGVCGTNSPVGGWESYDGRILILREDGTYSFIDTGDASHSGTWERVGAMLCLTHDIGAQECLGYQQRVDAMMLNEAIYIRE